MHLLSDDVLLDTSESVKDALNISASGSDPEVLYETDSTVNLDYKV